MDRSYRIAVIPGDGIGKEVVPAALEILDIVSNINGFRLLWQSFDWSCERYVKTGSMMPDDGIDQLRTFDAILLGAVGFPGVPDHISLWGLLIPIRREFDQYINLRPVKSFRGVPGALASPFADDIDFCIVRENCEGEYSEIGGRVNRGSPDEFVIQQSVFTRRGCDRVMRYAFDLASKRRNKIASATKSNGIIHAMPFWDERFHAIQAEYKNVVASQFHIDILTAHFVRHPEWFDVVVASNLFGDILSDLGPALVGSIGIAPGANINPERVYPSMFEPVHGSAPDIAGKGIANPIGQISSGAMMLSHLGETTAAHQLESAIADLLADPSAPRTADLGGRANLSDVVSALRARIIE
jgi:tartrate dehydrogenase/decarboxylase/D-malate dehydrogenase